MNNKKSEVISVNSKTLFISGLVLLSGLIIAAGLFISLRSTKPSQEADVSGVSSPTQPKVRSTQTPTPVPEQTSRTSIDDDPILGNKATAKVVIVEFSDYECPYCEKFWNQTLGMLKENYINTGQVILVYRDLPLSFHNPAATREANAAECAGKFGGDEVYYQFHDEIYGQTPGNGKGLSAAKLVDIGAGLGLDKVELAGCIENEEFADEIKKDIADASKAGITGTPGFIVGMLDEDGGVEGVVIKGAYPYSRFEQIIESFLESEGGSSLSAKEEKFLGVRGETLRSNEGRVYIDEAQVSDGNMHLFNFYSEKKAKNIYFLVVKAIDGTYRAAANACEVCYGAQRGFVQVENGIRCENCRQVYSKDQIALQKGGCNPRPIDRDVNIVNGRLEIAVADIEGSADLF